MDTIGNIFQSIPNNVDSEIFDVIIKSDSIRVERILSKGQSSPESGWHDQEENEWVIVLQGSGTIVFENENELTLEKGDFINIPSRQKHKVIWTEPDVVTIWLAIFYL
jgi:cupin 2 domain-containing protein